MVAGGTSAITPIELLNTDSKQWYTGPPTPLHWTDMRTAIMGNQCYFMGGLDNVGLSTPRVFSMSFPALLSQLRSKKSGLEIWNSKEIPGLQFTRSSPLSIGGSSLAIGGSNKNKDAVSEIHLYKPDTGEWVKVGDLPTPRSRCTSVMLTDRELLVAGGWDGRNMSKRVDIILLSINKFKF